MVGIRHVSDMLFLHNEENGILTRNIQGKKLKTPIKIFRDNKGIFHKGWDERYHPFNNPDAKPLKKPFKEQNLKEKPFVNIKEYGRNVKGKRCNFTETKELAKEYYRDNKNENLPLYNYKLKDLDNIYNAIDFLELNGVIIKTNFNKFTHNISKNTWILLK